MSVFFLGNCGWFWESFGGKVFGNQQTDCTWKWMVGSGKTAFLLGWPIFRCYVMLVSGRVYRCIYLSRSNRVHLEALHREIWRGQGALPLICPLMAGMISDFLQFGFGKGSWWMKWGLFKSWRVWCLLGGGFKYSLFSPLPGEMIQVD